MQVSWLQQGFDENNNLIINKRSTSKYNQRVNNQTNAYKLPPAQYANTVYNGNIGQMLDYKNRIIHTKKENQEWWQR